MVLLHRLTQSSAASNTRDQVPCLLPSESVCPAAVYHAQHGGTCALGLRQVISLYVLTAAIYCGLNVNCLAAAVNVGLPRKSSSRPVESDVHDQLLLAATGQPLLRIPAVGVMFAETLYGAPALLPDLVNRWGAVHRILIMVTVRHVSPSSCCIPQNDLDWRLRVTLLQSASRVNGQVVCAAALLACMVVCCVCCRRA